MEKWYRGQVARMANPKSRPIQNSLDFGPPADGNASPYPWHHYEVRARAEINALIEEMQLDADEIVSDAMVLAWMSDMSDESENNERSEERRVGNGCVSKCRSRCRMYH